MTLNDIVVHAQALVDEMNARKGIDNVELVIGQKYVKIISDRNTETKYHYTEGFIDINGNVLYGDYYRPSKGKYAARGNIFSDKKGFEALNESGYVRYHRE